MLNSPSIGYVWVMRVFLLMALMAPPLLAITRHLRWWSTMLLIGAILILQQVLVVCVLPNITNTIARIIFDQYILYTIGYSPLLILGLSIRNFSQKEQFATTIAFIIVITLMLTIGGISFNPQATKYPPHELYLVYGLTWCSLLWSAKPCLNRLSNKAMTFISENSMWLYLWHIIPVFSLLRMPFMEHSFWLRYAFVILVTLLLFKIQNVVERYFHRR
jgi:hypothetical protein